MLNILSGSATMSNHNAYFTIPLIPNQLPNTTPQKIVEGRNKTKPLQISCAVLQLKSPKDKTVARARMIPYPPSPSISPANITKKVPLRHSGLSRGCLEGCTYPKQVRPLRQYLVFKKHGELFIFGRFLKLYANGIL